MASFFIGGAVGYVAKPSTPGEQPGDDRGVRKIEAYFSPNGGCLGAILAKIRSAKSTILVQAFSFTSKTIAAELVAAKARGVVVRVAVDSDAARDRNSIVPALLEGGVDVLVDAKHAIAHSKVMIVDSFIVITGSYNFSESAERRNLENMLVIRDAILAAKYAANWEAHAAHSISVAPFPVAP
jgi:phosphatidylserine/phosphatidylglycerophosphate/cardiolipin synthase-like enzyme